MIDLTPLDVRNKRGDFKKLMRGYDPDEVDVFLELVAERLEALVRENLQLRDRTQTLQAQVDAQAGREQAVQDALVTAQELRKDIRDQSQREADHLIREAESEARRLIAEAEAEVRARMRGIERQVDHARDALQELERRRARFLQEFRGLLQRELDVVQVEEDRTPLEDRAIDLELGHRRGAGALATAASPNPGGTVTGVDAGSQGGSHGSEGVAEDRVEADPGDTVPDVPSGADGTAAESTGGGSGAGGDGADGADGGDVGSSTGQGTHATADPSGTDSGAASPGSSSSPASDAGPAPDAARSSGGATASLAAKASAPPPSVGDQPSSLELELVAGASSPEADVKSGPAKPPFPDVPDLETVLAEAGIDEVKPPPPQEIAPPPAPRSEEDMILFDRDEKDATG
jgi:DivIVA domain-containing protein